MLLKCQISSQSPAKRLILVQTLNTPADQVLIDPTFGIFVCGPLLSFVANVCTLCILGKLEPFIDMTKVSKISVKSLYLTWKMQCL